MQSPGFLHSLSLKLINLLHNISVIKTVIVENVLAVKYRTAYRQTFQTLLPVVTNSLYVYATHMNLPSK